MSKKKSATTAKAEPKSETPDEKFERVSARVVAAVNELNEALKEAHGQTNMTVGLGRVDSEGQHPTWPWKPDAPSSITYHIARVMKCSMAFAVNTRKSPPSVWKMVTAGPEGVDGPTAT